MEEEEKIQLAVPFAEVLGFSKFFAFAVVDFDQLHAHSGTASGPTDAAFQKRGARALVPGIPLVRRPQPLSDLWAKC